MNYFNAMTMSLDDAKALWSFHKTIEKLNLSSSKTRAIVVTIYLTTEQLWAEMRQETDYDDYH